MATLTIERTVKEEIDVEFPMFKRLAPHVYKLFSEEEFISLTDYEGWDQPSIEKLKNKAIASRVIFTGTDITENEFVDAFVKTVHTLNELVKKPAATEAASIPSIEFEMTSQIVPGFINPEREQLARERELAKAS